MGLLYAVLSPGSSVPKLPTFPGFDKLVHFTLFFGLVFLWARVWNKPATGEIKIQKIILNYLVFGVILAIFTEYLQAYVPNRSFDYLDIGANITGGTIGMVLFVYLNKKRSILV
ncbi:MAG: VanZ family protein [Lunatimonas sp.]|uniref:VanZ family protein n=1 Tax=Lunatimonas sp. TaxID=2060141 RepID=UPI00263BBA10|nr:VanZ family protein [Lunatimonas sp.]MCC5938734.1 VanZ family protein [Lunatimonas sp.]